MSPTEQTILTNFLLPPAPLPTITTLATFTSFFPRAQQTSSAAQIKALYRDLQHQRAKLTDRVGVNVQREVKRGEKERAEVVSARRRGGGEEVDEEGAVEDLLNNNRNSNLPSVARTHTLNSVLPELERAVEDLEEEVRRDEEEAEALLEEMRGIVGALSDLRYGRLANGEVREQVLDGLARLENACEDQR